MLAERGHEVSEDTAREDISTQLGLMADRMRVGRQAARAYITDDYVEKLADHIARIVDQHHTKTVLNPRHLRAVPPPD